MHGWLTGNERSIGGTGLELNKQQVKAAGKIRATAFTAHYMFSVFLRETIE
ncbi:hypothetical protein [Paenibacillus sp. yr247]|uniref:hypothetical protein n=1 Tax=Paenibacillus sp. yr247 TaxID=1761880 RepID=UPI001C313C6E|nr:hypothetical protein [Paenibacillus sp. yr247]